MAEIIIKPGEVFEHLHPYETKTKLIEGTIKFYLNGKEIRLNKGEEISVPAGVAHKSVNVDMSIARLECGSCTLPPPEPLPLPLPVPPPEPFPFPLPLPLPPPPAG